MTTPLMQKQLTVFGDYADVDLAALGASAAKLTLSYSHAAQLSFSITAAEHTVPIERLAFVRFWMSGAKLDDGTTNQSADHPLFEGYIESLGPGGDANRVNVVCFDPTYRVARELTVMSTAWTPGDPPVEGVGAIPRLVYNATDESDSDYAFNVGGAGTIGQIMAGILEICQEMLWHRNCCPGLSSSALAYVSDDLTGLTFKPQEKIVWESENVRAATERLQRYEPRVRLVWEPGDRLWRFRDITTAPEVTLRLNDPTVDFPVLSLDLTPSLDKCYTAIKIYGPPITTTEEFVWLDSTVAPDDWVNTLQPVGSAVTIETIGLATDITTYKGWQIVDESKRRGARLLPEWYALRTSEYLWDQTKYPQFLLTWDGGNTWIGAEGCFLDFLNGQAIFPSTMPYATAEQQFGQTATAFGQHYFPPNGAKLLWAPYGTALTVRVPDSGFQGTAYTVAGLQLENRVYDGQLAIGYEYGNPVTSDARREQMALYATSLLEKVQDITWVGGAVLDGIDYSWCRLNRRVSFEASDGSGGTTTTGWEAIKAFVTDVEYDFAEQTTTIQFSSDRAEAIGEDPSNIKQRLKIKALQQVQYQTDTLLFRTEVNWRGETYQELSGVQSHSGFQYVDPDTGMIVAQD